MLILVWNIEKDYDKKLRTIEDFKSLTLKNVTHLGCIRKDFLLIHLTAVTGLAFKATSQLLA